MNGKRTEWGRTLRHLLAGILVLCLAASSAVAQDLGERVKLHGFGGWAAGDTDGNQYLGGEEGREYDSISFALSATAEASDRLVISAQLFTASEEEDIDTDLDFAFAEWTFSDRLKLRGGLVKHPFGLQTEVIRVGTIRPFFELAQGLYGPAEFIAEAYQGIGFTGRREIGSGWGLQYDVYGGEIGLESTEAFNPLLSFGGEEEEEEEEEEGGLEKLKDVLGGRLNLFAPGGKVKFGISGYFGTPEEEEEEADSASHEVLGVHFQYLDSDWSLRLEAAHRHGGDEDIEGDTFYLELARHVGEHWQLAARYDRSELDADGVEPGSLLEHEDWALGLNYWFNGNFVIKLSYHLVDGNLFAFTDQLDDLETETRLLQLGLQFSF